MSVYASPHDTLDTLEEQLRTSPSLTDSGVSVRDPGAVFPYYLTPHLLAQRVLGEGGSAVVLEAIHTRLKVSVAVKILKLSGPGANEARERMQREAELCARIDNPRIPHVFDADVLADGTPYVVMERVHGRLLSELLNHGPLDVDLACTIACDLLEALAELHGAGIIHRDIKPSNLVLEESAAGTMRVRVLDLGIAKPFLFEAGINPYGAPLTLSGEMLGTPHYMSNEQLLGGYVDERTDLYAVGVLLYEILAGTTPFTGASVSQVIASALHDEPKPLSELRPDLRQELYDVVKCAMDRDAAMRFRSAREMCDALQGVLTAERKTATDLPGSDEASRAENERWAKRVMESVQPTESARSVASLRTYARYLFAGFGAAVALGWPAQLPERPSTAVQARAWNAPLGTPE